MRISSMGMQTGQIACCKKVTIKKAKKSLLTLWPAQVTVTPILQEVKLKYETIVFSIILLRWRLKSNKHRDSFWRQRESSIFSCTKLNPTSKGWWFAKTELALPVNTRSSEIKVTSPKFVCLKQIKLSAAQYPYKMLARKTAIVDEPLNFRWL